MRRFIGYGSIVILAAVTMSTSCYAGGFGRALLAGIAEGALDSAVDAAEAAAEEQQGPMAPMYARPAATTYQAYLQQNLEPGSVIYNRPCTISDGVHERGVPCEAAAAMVSAPVPRGVFPGGRTAPSEETYGADYIPGFAYGPGHQIGAYGYQRAGFVVHADRRFASANAGRFRSGSSMSFGRVRGRHR